MKNEQCVMRSNSAKTLLGYFGPRYTYLVHLRISKFAGHVVYTIGLQTLAHGSNSKW